MRRLVVAAAAAGLALLGVAAPASALNDLAGNPIPNTGLQSPTPSLLKLLADPATPLDDDPAALALLGSPGNPEDDLAGALDVLADPDPTIDSIARAAARERALAILDGTPIAGKAYSGMPLLNDNPAAKVKTVPDGGTVTVRMVRFGDHVLTDTWRLEFANPNAPFTIRYEIAELSDASGGELTPMPLLAENGTPLGGVRSAATQLDLTRHGSEERPTGTKDRSRLTDDRGFPPQGAPERTRAGTQAIEVPMPPPKYAAAFLEPSVRTGPEALATLHPTSPERAAATETINALAAQSPERQIWDGLQAGVPTTDQAAGLRALVGTMRTRTELPPGISSTGADVTIAFLNNEVYVSRTSLRPGSGPVTVKVVNKDGFAHGFDPLELNGAKPVFDPVNLDNFGWRGLNPLGAASVGAGETQTFTLQPSATASALWLGDPNHGDQAAMIVELDRGPLTQSLRFGPDFAAPLHDTQDREGKIWVTLEGVDKIARITPAADLASSQREEFPLPGGAHTPTSPNFPLAPHDIMVDGHGIVWATLTLGNAIARIDPSQVQDGTSTGIRIYELEPCNATLCPPEFPPPPAGTPASRGPLQMQGLIDGAGNSVIFFTEAFAGKIGVLRVAPDGTKLTDREFTCACVGPTGLALDPDGSLWFAESEHVDQNGDGRPDADGSRIGRLRFDQARPYSPSAVTLDHFDIPRCLELRDPLHPQGVCTNAPHTVALDFAGRVWFTEEATGRVSYLDPGQAQPNTGNGFRQWDAQETAFGAPGAPADMAMDGAGRMYWADEYGDIIGTFTKDGPDPGHGFRPSARRSLTDEPLIDHEGNLWFLELGANLLTRISGVAEPVPLPAAPPVFEARTSADSVSAERLRGIPRVNVKVRRGDALVTQAVGVVVSDGRFQVGPSDWQGSPADAVQPGDRITIEPQGEPAREPLSFVVATLSAAVQGDGSAAGQALAGGAALADAVTVESGGQSRPAPIQAEDGAWRTEPFGLDPAAAAGSVTWSGATVAGIFRTVTSFGPQAVEPAPAPDPGSIPPGPTQPSPDNPGDGGEPPCGRTWLTDSGASPAVRFLGMSAAAAKSCLGEPTSVRRFTTIARVRRGERLRRARVRSERWTYGRTMELTLRSGRVASYELRGRNIRSASGNLGVGTTTRALRAALPALRPAGAGALRGAVRLRGRQYAEIVFHVARGRVARISVVTRGSRPRGVPVLGGRS